MWNINRYICKVLHNARIKTRIIICPMYSYVLFYNIEKSGLNAVSASFVKHLSAKKVKKYCIRKLNSIKSERLEGAYWKH